MSQFDLQLLNQFPLLKTLEHRLSLDSTNDFSRQNLERLSRQTPAIVLTDQQTAGRGRGSNVWWSEHGALTFSLVESTTSIGLPAEKVPTLSLAVGLATQRLISEFTAEAVTVKWPNDVYLNDRKCCGILIEQQRLAGQSYLIIGVGINVNNSLQQGPEALRQTSTSMTDATDREFDMTTVLMRWLENWNAASRELVEDSEAFFTQLNRVSLLNGRRVHVEMPDRRLEGVVDQIDSTGQLLLETPSGMVPVTAGSVRLLDS